MKLTHNFLILPIKIISVKELLISNGKNHEESKKIISNTGINNLRVSEEIGLSDFVIKGLLKLREKQSEVFVGIEAIIVISQTFDKRIPSLSTRIQGLLGLHINTFCMDIIDGCSGFIKGLAITQMLEDSGYGKVLIISGDINSLITNGADIGTKILFGDGISVTLFKSDTYKIKAQIRNEGDIQGVISCDSKNNLMEMDGFEVFRFTKSNVPKLIGEFTSDLNKNINSYELIAFHQASKMIVSNLCTILNVSNRLSDDFNCGSIGNLGAGSIGAWLSNIEELPSKGKLEMLAVGFGSGLSWGVAQVLIEIEQNMVVYV